MNTVKSDIQTGVGERREGGREGEPCCNGNGQTLSSTHVHQCMLHEDECHWYPLWEYWILSFDGSNTSFKVATVAMCSDSLTVISQSLNT